MYVPIVHIIIEPIQNANKPAIEKTHRTEKCPIYLVKCYKRQWGVTAKVTSKPVVDGDDLWKVPHMAGFTLVESEMQRCRAKFPRGLFDSVYADPDVFAEEFNKVAVEENPNEIDRAKRDEENREAGLARATKAVLRAAGDAEVQAKRAKGGRPLGSKNKTPVTVPE